jgi:hypothetical protein
MTSTKEAATSATDAVREALAALDAALAAHAARSAAMRDRIAQVARERDAGRTYREIVAGEAGPLLVEMLTEATHALDTAGAVVRRAEASALYDEGLTMTAIAERFGVSRQRVSALLRDRRPSPDPA